MDKSIAYFNSLFDLSQQPSWIYNLESLKILDVNQAAIDHYGYTKNEFLKLDLKDLRPKEDTPQLFGAIDELLNQEGTIFRGVFTHHTKSGVLIRMKVNAQEVNFMGEQSVLVVCQDVTEEENRVHQLKISEERLKAATEISKLGYWRLELDGNSLRWTDEVYKIWGLEREKFDLSYINFFQTIHSRDREAFEREQLASFSGKQKLDFIHRIVLPDSSIRWVHEQGRLVTDDNGKPIGFEGTVQDITSRKIEEERLKLLESVITNTNDAILITEAEPLDDPGPKIMYVNEAFTKMTGYSADEVIGKSPRILQGPNTDKEEMSKLSKALRNWESYQTTTLNYKKNGEEFWINFTVTPVANEQGWYTHWIAIERDVTEQKQKQLENDLLGKISSNFSIENDLSAASNEVCNTISEFGKFDFVELWLVNLENTEIQLLANSSTTAKSDEFYKNCNEVSSFNIGEGLPGIVWLKTTSILWKDVRNHNDNIRKEAAEIAGIETALGIPLLFDNKIVGVLIIGTHQDINYLKKYVNVFEQLEHYIGSEINRKKLENDLQHLYDAIPDLICITDLNGRFIKINKAGCDIIGYSEAEILYNTFERFVHPDDIELSNKDLVKLNKGHKTFGFENRYLTKSGDVIWLSWTSNSNLKEGLIYATAKNITEQKKLRDLNRRANALAKIGGWEIDILREKIYWSNLVHEMHETDSKSFVPDLKSGINFYRDDFREMVQASIEKTIREGEPFDFEAILVTARKNERWVRAIGNPEFVDGQCTRIFGSFQDIHKSKAMELQISEILGSISDAFYAVDKDWNFTYFNKEAENLLLKKKVDVIGKNIWDEFPAAKGTLLEEIYIRVTTTGKADSFDYFFPGDSKWYEVNAYPSNGGISAYFKNIDEKKQAARQLERAFEERNTILESIGDAFFNVNKDWIVTYWNKEAENILGKKRKAIIGKYLWEVYADAIDTEFYRNYHKAMETQRNISFEEYYPTLHKWFEVAVYPSSSGLSVYFKDVTLRKQADIRLVQANERFEKVTEATNDAIWDWDLVNKSFYRSHGIERFFGEHASKTISEKDFWNDGFHPDDLPKIQKSIQKAIDDPHSSRWEMEYKVNNSLGQTVFVNDRGLILRDKKGKATRMVGAMTDITEQKNYELQLLQLNESIKQYAHQLELTNQELEQFAFVASHDLQEPLRMISSFLDQLKRKYGNQLDDKAHQYIHYATDGAKRMKQIILDLLDYSRAGKLTDSINRVDLNEILDQYKSLRRKIIREKSAKIKIGKLPVVQSYVAPITQTIHCLLDNAIKYSSDDQPPKIDILAKESEEFWTISIKDNGLGIAPEFFDKIFILFQRLHNRDDYGGTGIGLSVAKKHVESWGGKIWLESELGKGSTFYFTHPKKFKKQ